MKDLIKEGLKRGYFKNKILIKLTQEQYEKIKNYSDNLSKKDFFDFVDYSTSCKESKAVYLFPVDWRGKKIYSSIQIKNNETLNCANVMGNFIERKVDHLFDEIDIRDQFIPATLDYIIENEPNTIKPIKTTELRTHKRRSKNNKKHFQVYELNDAFFTEYIQINETKVKGHFAKRRYGKGRKLIKTVFIEQYNKKPYKRKSKRDKITS